MSTVYSNNMHDFHWSTLQLHCGCQRQHKPVSHYYRQGVAGR
jgi:hypothetical protein